MHNSASVRKVICRGNIIGRIIVREPSFKGFQTFFRYISRVFGHSGVFIQKLNLFQQYSDIKYGSFLNHRQEEERCVDRQTDTQFVFVPRLFIFGCIPVWKKNKV